MDSNSPMATIWVAIKKFIILNVENAKLTATEKLTILFSALAFYLVAIALVIVAIGFASMALCEVLSTQLEKHYVYLLMAAIYSYIVDYLFDEEKVVLKSYCAFLFKANVKSP